MSKTLPPHPLPTCACPPPPVYTGFWTDLSWRKWIAMHCNCYGHLMWRALDKP